MELSDKTEQELLQELGDLKKQLLGLSLKKCSGTLPKSHVISDLKKQIARLHTFLRQKTCKSCNN